MLSAKKSKSADWSTIEALREILQKKVIDWITDVSEDLDTRSE